MRGLEEIAEGRELEGMLVEFGFVFGFVFGKGFFSQREAEPLSNKRQLWEEVDWGEGCCESWVGGLFRERLT